MIHISPIWQTTALTRMRRLRPHIEHGHLEIDNNRPNALCRKNYVFMGSASGGKAAAMAHTLIKTARLNDIDPQAWLVQVLERIPGYNVQLPSLSTLNPFIRVLSESRSNASELAYARIVPT